MKTVVAITMMVMALAGCKQSQSEPTPAPATPDCSLGAHYEFRTQDPRAVAAWESSQGCKFNWDGWNHD